MIRKIINKIKAIEDNTQNIVYFRNKYIKLNFKIQDYDKINNLQLAKNEKYEQDIKYLKEEITKLRHDFNQFKNQKFNIFKWFKKVFKLKGK